MPAQGVPAQQDDAGHEQTGSGHRHRHAVQAVDCRPERGILGSGELRSASASPPIVGATGSGSCEVARRQPSLPSLADRQAIRAHGGAGRGAPPGRPASEVPEPASARAPCRPSGTARRQASVAANAAQCCRGSRGASGEVPRDGRPAGHGRGKRSPNKWHKPPRLLLHVEDGQTALLELVLVPGAGKEGIAKPPGDFAAKVTPHGSSKRRRRAPTSPVVHVRPPTQRRVGHMRAMLTFIGSPGGAPERLRPSTVPSRGASSLQSTIKNPGGDAVSRKRLGRGSQRPGLFRSRSARCGARRLTGRCRSCKTLAP